MRLLGGLVSGAVLVSGLAIEQHHDNSTWLSPTATTAKASPAYSYLLKPSHDAVPLRSQNGTDQDRYGGFASSTGHGSWSAHMPTISPSSTNNTTVSLASETRSSVNWTSLYPTKSANQSSSESSSTATPTASSTKKGPTATLYPAIHWDFDRFNSQNLKPAKAKDAVPLYYAQEGSSDRSKPFSMAFMKPHFNAESVVLDHSAFIETVEFSPPNELLVTFNEEEAFRHSQLDWSVEEGLILITNTPDCGNYVDGERCYFSVTQLHWEPEGLYLRASGSASPLADIIDEIEMEWGVWEPKQTKLESLKEKTCGTQSDEESDLPTACPGPLFDTDLDNALGYEDHPYNFDVDLKALDVRKRVRRGAGNPPPDNNIWINAVEDVIEGMDHIIDDGFDKLRDPFWWGTQNFTARRDGLLLPPRPADCLNGTNELCHPKNGSLRIVPSPWGRGDAILMKSFGFGTHAPIIPNGQINEAMGQLNLWCVDCGLSGSVGILGKIVAKPGQGITEGFIQIDADIKAALKLGIEGKLEYFASSPRMNLFETGLPGFTIPGGVTIGPMLNVAVDFRVNTAIRGKFLAGGEYYLSKAMYKFDIKNKINSATGWDASFRPVLEADGEARVAAELGLPITISLGLNILGGKCSWCKWNVGVETRPAIEAVAGQVGTGFMLNSTAGMPFNASSVGMTRKVITKNDCKGWSSHLQWKNVVMAIAFVAGQRFQQILLDSGPRLIAEKCHAFPNISSSFPNISSNFPNISSSFPHISRRSITLRDDDDSEAVPGSGIIDLTDTVVSTKDYLDYGYEMQPRDLADGTRYDKLGSPAAAWSLYGCDDNNIYLRAATDSERLSGCNDVWEYHNALIGANGLGRRMHYYENTMSTLGVSRLRLSEGSLVPKSSSYVSLAPSHSHNPDTSSIYLAVAEDRKVYYPVVCKYADAGLASKVFLVADPKAGLSKLEDPKLESFVTGGKVAECAFLPLFQV